MSHGNPTLTTLGKPGSRRIVRSRRFFVMRVFGQSPEARRLFPPAFGTGLRTLSTHVGIRTIYSSLRQNRPKTEGADPCQTQISFACTVSSPQCPKGPDWRCEPPDLPS